MRPIHLARLDTTRPVVVLTRERARSSMTLVTIVPITSRARGLVSEVPVGRRHGLDGNSVISCDNVKTIPADALGRVVGFLGKHDEVLLTKALVAAFDLSVEDLG